MERKVAIVTGAARGLGSSIAEDIVAEGGQVLLCDLLEEQGREVAERLGSAARFMKMDVTKAVQWAAAMQHAEAAFGPVQVLVNNAALIELKGFDEITEEDFRAVSEVNELGCFLGMKAVVPSMRRAGGGSIVNISSVAGLHSAGGLAYTASKFAIRGMSKAAAYYLGPDKIRVNSVHPGWMRTPQTEVAPLGWVSTLLPLRQIAEPSQVAKVVSFLASDDAAMITGSEYLVDGGAMLMGTLDIVARMGEHMGE
ncbi:SDR family NAD(P)-dependent oxidoreductase [Burkholderia seminalis]|uniref:SDR family NAD(P)-dependent oxidoreductase n=1 Tax=Burkholderia seminalis TaxID=488731 RepID=UPI001ABBBB7C|nr:glucose 1-dehydrogenase [Burkholderia seminalis]